MKKNNSASFWSNKSPRVIPKVRDHSDLPFCISVTQRLALLYQTICRRSPRRIDLNALYHNIVYLSYRSRELRISNRKRRQLGNFSRQNGWYCFISRSKWFPPGQQLIHQRPQRPNIRWLIGVPNAINHLRSHVGQRANSRMRGCYTFLPPCTAFSSSSSAIFAIPKSVIFTSRTLLPPTAIILLGLRSLCTTLARCDAATPFASR